MRGRRVWLTVAVTMGAAGVGAASLFGCTRSAEAPRSSPARGPVTISILATNDVHGQLERLSVFSGFVDNLRRARQRDGGVLLLDGGDAFQGTIESNLNEGAAVLRTFATMGYAAMTVGNHEFDFGPEGPRSLPSLPGDDPQGALKKRIAEAAFPFVSANLVTDEGRPPAWKNLYLSRETTIAGVKIGIIGLITTEAPDVVKRPDFAGLHVEPLAFAAAREAVALRKDGAQIVVVLAHSGGECTRFDDPNDTGSCDGDSEIFRFARALPPNLVDVIVGGHRNAGVAHVVAGIPIVHAPSHLVSFSRVDVELDRAGRVVEKRVRPPHPLCTAPVVAGSAPAASCVPGSYEGAPVAPNPAAVAAIAPALADARALRDRPVGVVVAAPFPVEKHGETAIGNLFADVFREALPGADAAMNNPGSIRDVLPAGTLTYGQLHHVMPFDNQLVRVRMTGAELRAVAKENLSRCEHGLLSWSGLRVGATCHGDALDVELERSDGSKVRDDDQLTIVTNDFLAFGGDGVLSVAKLPPDRIQIDTTKSELEHLIDGFSRRSALRPDDPALFDPARPRVRIPSTPPLRCEHTTSR